VPRTRLVPRRNRGYPIRTLTAPAKILPWDSQRDRPSAFFRWKFSARFWPKFREEWDRAQGAPLASRISSLTVPRPVRREGAQLTREWRRGCGIERPDAVEEPARLLFLDRETTWRSRGRSFSTAQTVLVCDVAGHQRLQPDSRFALGRTSSTSPAPRGEAPAAWEATTWI